MATALKRQPVAEREYRENRPLDARRNQLKERSAQTNPRLRRQVCVVFMTLAVLMAFQICQRELIVRGSYELVATKVKVNSLQKENDFLKIELAGLQSPERIQQAATAQLGMVVPQQVHYVHALPSKPDGESVAAARP